MEKTKENIFNKTTIALLAVITILIVINQFQLSTISRSFNGVSYGGSNFISLSGGDLKNVDITQITSTAQGVALLFPINKIKTAQDAINIMIPTGTPEYGKAMGVLFDDPVNSMESLSRAYTSLKKQAQQNPEIWNRYLSLAAAPRGISCEFCCGVGPQGITSDGNLKCGCKHNPAVQSLTLWLIQNTDYSDAEILREIYKWKTLWFPKNMVELASQIAGGDTSVLQDLPGMVGGC